jgi:hypothetical protein
VVINTNGTTIANSWGAGLSGSAGTITITSDQTWNSNVPAGATAYNPSVGFCATRPPGNQAPPTVVGAVGS